MKNYKDVAEEYFNENWWCSKLEQNYVLSLPFPTTQQHKRAAKYPSENHRLCCRTLFSFPVLRSTLLWGCLLVSRQPAKKSWSGSTEIRQAAGSVCRMCGARLDCPGVGIFMEEVVQGQGMHDKENYSWMDPQPVPNPPCFPSRWWHSMVPANIYLAPKLLLVLGEQRWKDAKKNTK